MRRVDTMKVKITDFVNQSQFTMKHIPVHDKHVQGLFIQKYVKPTEQLSESFALHETIY